MVICCRDRRLIKGDILEESTCFIPNDSWRLKGKRKTKNYLKKDSWERAKQSRVEKPGSSQSGCTRQKFLVRQRRGLICLLAQWDMMVMKSVDFGPDWRTESWGNLWKWENRASGGTDLWWPVWNLGGKNKKWRLLNKFKQLHVHS